MSASYSGVISTNNLTDTDSDGYKNFDSTTPIDGTLILTITAPNSDIVNLEGIVVTIDEYIDIPEGSFVRQVFSVVMVSAAAILRASSFQIFSR